jgi:L-proline---[L-prolyl-carrier protein] ligase
MRSSRVCSDCLEDGARLNPSGIALEGDGREIPYAELKGWCARFAPGEEQGEPRVALWAEKSPEAVAALLGILASGRTCVPIDDMNPPERVRRILEDARPGGLLVSDRLVETARALARESLPGTRLSEISKPPSGEPKSVLRPRPEDLAYLLYTSGSTGTPKGVMISHRAAMTFIDWASRKFELQTDDRVASIAPLHFDLSLFDILATLSVGATICLCPRGILSFPESFLDWIQASRITTLYAVPSLLASIAEAPASMRLKSVKRILFAGEVMPPKVLERLMDAAPWAKFYNLYGPTETNVCAVHSIDHGSSVDRPVPIGHACPYNRVEVVAEDGSLAPPGSLGEIRVDGPNLMSGYWGLPRSSGPYLTGDLGIMDPDGLLHFHGRHDEMLKIRGYRVECGEVEAAIGAHPEVKQVACFKAAEPPGPEALRAAVVLRPGSSLGEKELKVHCGERLPHYMIPEKIEFRSSLPLNQNGKVDRLALRRASR